MIEKILELMKKNEVKASELTNNAGLPHSAITHWKKGAAKPSSDAIIKIAKYFNVTTDYLLGLSNLPTGSGQQVVAKESVSELPYRDVAELLYIFDKLDSVKKQRLLGYAESLLDPAVSGADSTVK